MKLIALAAAGATLLTGLAAAAPADAQRVVHERTVVTQHRQVRAHRARTVCDWRRRGHQRVKVCRTVRSR